MPVISESEALAYLGSGEETPYPLESVRPTPSRVLEIGAGAGSGTLQIAAAFPAARVVCLEPDDAARTALAWRIAGDAGLRDRVSVLPLTLYEADFLGTFDLVLARNLLSRTPPDERAAVLVKLSRRMGYDGSAIVDDRLGPETNAPEPRRMVAQERFGEFTCSHWTSAETAGRGQRDVVHEYVVADRRGDVIHQARHESTEWVADRELMLALIRAGGMAPAAIAEGWLRLSTP